MCSKLIIKKKTELKVEKMETTLSVLSIKATTVNLAVFPVYTLHQSYTIPLIQMYSHFLQISLLVVALFFIFIS